MRIHAPLLASIFLLFACSDPTITGGGNGGSGGSGGNGGTGSAGGTGGGAGGTGGSGGSAITCGGLGCEPCDSMNLNVVVCESPAACAADADCADMLPGACKMDLGTYTDDFFAAGCLGGKCAYHVVSAGCADFVTCSDCTEQGKSQACFLKGPGAACAACCADYYWGGGHSAVFQACACGAGKPCESACATSKVCGGQGPETDACAACLKQSLLEGGACVSSSDFQSACVNDPSSPSCKHMSQCLATCPAP